jgi:DNA transformation protein and related proteins
MKNRGTESELRDMPNVGEEVAGLLAAAGVPSPRQLKRIGAVAAAIRIGDIRPDDPPCRSMLAGLEGAIRGVRWQTLPKGEREAIWKEYQARTSGRPVRATARP